MDKKKQIVMKKIKNNKKTNLVKKKVSVGKKLKTKEFLIGLLGKKLSNSKFSLHVDSNKFLRRVQTKKKKLFLKKVRFKKKYRLGLFIENRKYRKKKFKFKSSNKVLLTTKYNSFVVFNKEQIM